MKKNEFLFGLEKKRIKLENYCKELLNDKDEFKDIKGKLSIVPTFLFHGYPGTGKTTLANKIYWNLKKEYNIDLKYLQLETILSHNFGESSKNLKDFFEEIKKEIKVNKSIVFIILDELDSFGGNRYENDSESIKRVLLTFNTIIDEFVRDGTINNLIIVATTNLKESLDTSVLRRFFFEEDFNIFLEKNDFEIYLHKLLKMTNLLKINNQEITDALFNIYIEKKMTIGEFKLAFAHYYMDLKTTEEGIDIVERLEKRKSFHELISIQNTKQES